MLRQVSDVLQQHVGNSDLLARLGGDEFALIVRNCSGNGAHDLAQTLCREIQGMPFFWNERRHSVTLSVGLVEFGTLQLPFSEALSLADTACFLAKKRAETVYRSATLAIRRSLSGNAKWTG